MMNALKKYLKESYSIVASGAGLSIYIVPTSKILIGAN